MTIRSTAMSAVAILAAIWAWALLPPLLARGHRNRRDPIVAFARFQARDARVAPIPARRALGQARRRAQVLATLVVADVTAAVAWLLLQDRRLLGAAAGGFHLTVGWYGLAVRRRLAARCAGSPAPVVALPARPPGLATAA